MKINKKIFVCALLVLMLLCCVNAASAEETFNETLGADVADDLAIDATPDESLNAGGDTLSVDENIGDYKTASDADASGAGDEVLSASDADPELAAGNTVYVSTSGSDSNDGLSEANAVATINHAVDIADGKIVILAGEYTVTSLLNISKDLEITGQGDVTIKSNSKYTVDVWDDYWEEWDTETHYMLINNSANLKLDNIKFTLVPASVSDQLINNLGNLYMTDCEFSNIKITSGRGVIQNAKGGYAEVKGTTFQTASGTYGAINNNGELLVDGCKFLDNDRSSDSGVYSTAITSYNKATILNSEFKNNKGTAGGAVYVMYSYTLKENPVMDIKNCTFDNNVAPGTSYTSGTGGAVKCNGKTITLNIEDSTFTNNNAKNGGAVYAEGNVTIINSVFHDNTASIGEDVYVASGSNTAVLGCTVDDESYLWEADGGNLTIGDAPVEEIKEIYVSPNGDNDNDGATRETAVATLNKAVELVPNGGTIYLLNGTYKIEMDDYWGNNVLFIGKSISFIGESVENTIIDFEENAYILTDYDEDGNPITYDFLTFENVTFKDGGIEAIFTIVGDVNELDITNCIMNGISSMALFALDGVKNLNIENSILITNGVSIIDIMSETPIELDIHNNILIGSDMQIIDEYEIATGKAYENYHIGYKTIANVPSLVESVVIANASVSPEGDILAGDAATIKVDFNSYNKSGEITESSNLIPSIAIDFTADGTLSADSVDIENGIATVTYTSDVERSDVIHISMNGNEIATLDVNVINPFTTNIVTNDTFYTFFDEDGILKESIPFDELIFQGNFSDLVDVVIIDRAITLTSDNAVLNDMALSIIDDDVKVDGFTLNANNVDFSANGGAAIYVSGMGVELNNVSVTYVAPSEVEAIAIYANAAEGFALTNSEIIFTSVNPGDKHNYGLKVRNSDEAVIDNNVINATLPAVPVSWGGTGIETDLVLAAGIQGGNGIEFTNNSVNVKTNGSFGSYPTVDAVMVHSTGDISIKSNNITHVDTTTEDGARYYYSLDIYNSTAVVDGNNIIVNTTAGVDRAGTAYPIQVTGPAVITIKNNNLTSVSKGATAGIYASNWAGEAIVTIENNTIDVTGYATTGNYALLSGIESEVDLTYIYSNTITVNNGAEYDDANQAYGVSMTSSYMSVVPVAEIMNNNITVNGNYAVYYVKASNTNITDNELHAYQLVGDDAAVIVEGENDLIKNNYPVGIIVTLLSGEDLVMSYKDGSAWTVTLINATGSPIAGETVGIGIKGKVYKVKTDAAGIASLPINLAPGTYDINATFEETDKYDSSFVNATITVGTGATILSADNLEMSYKDGSAWFVTLTDARGSVISGVNIAVGIKGATYNVKTDASGVAKLPINLAPGTYDINATFAGNKYYSEAFVNATVTVEKAVATLTASDLEMSYKDGSAYTVNVVDANGAAVANAVVKFTIGTSTYNVKTDASGVAKLPINVYIGEYDVTATLNDANYESEAVSNTITVKDYDAEIVASDVNMTYKDGTAYEVQLTDGEGNNIAVANLVVKITIKGSTYNVKTDANGIAKLPINLYVGTYDISAEYNGKVINNTITVNKA